MSRLEVARKVSGATFPGLIAMFFLYVGSIPSDVNLGPTSVAGVLTAGIAFLSIAIFPWLITLREERVNFRHQPWVRWLPVTWWLFLGWAFVSLGRLFTVDGAQNLAVWVAFTFTICAAAMTTTPESLRWLLNNIPKAAWLTAAVYAATVAIDDLGSNLIFGARAYAWTALIFMSVIVAAPSKSKWGRLLPIVLVLMIGATLSRTSLALAFLLLVALVLRGRTGTRALKASVILGAVGIGGWQLITKYEPMRVRFFEGDDALRIGGLYLNTSGRMEFWGKIWESAMIDPLLGRGLGSSVTITSRYYASYGTTQPHNDYLRIFHDLGMVGAITFIVAILAILKGSIGRAKRATDDLSRQIHTAAALSVGVIAVGMLTDNIVIYPFLMIPVGMLIGVSVANVDYPTHNSSDQVVPSVGELAPTGGPQSPHPGFQPENAAHPGRSDQ